MAIAKKKYFDVKLEIFGTIISLLAFKPEDLENKIIKFDLTKILKGKNCEGRFIVRKKDDKLIGEIYEFRLHPSYIRRLINRGVSIVEDSFKCKIKDKNIEIRLKPFLITRKRVHRSVRKALRETAKEFLMKTVEDKIRPKLFQEIVSAIIQKQLSKKLKKIYPLAVCELRIVKIEKVK